MFRQKLFGFKNKTTKGKARRDPIAKIVKQETMEAGSSTVEAADSTEPALNFKGFNLI